MKGKSLASLAATGTIAMVTALVAQSRWHSTPPGWTRNWLGHCRRFTNSSLTKISISCRMLRRF